MNKLIQNEWFWQIILKHSSDVLGLRGYCCAMCFWISSCFFFLPGSLHTFNGMLVQPCVSYTGYQTFIIFWLPLIHWLHWNMTNSIWWFSPCSYKLLFRHTIMVIGISILLVCSLFTVPFHAVWLFPFLILMEPW